MNASGSLLHSSILANDFYFRYEDYQFFSEMSTNDFCFPVK